MYYICHGQSRKFGLFMNWPEISAKTWWTMYFCHRPNNFRVPGNRWLILEVVIKAVQLQSCLIGSTDVHIVVGKSSCFYKNSLIVWSLCDLYNVLEWPWNAVNSLKELYSTYLFGILYGYFIWLFYNFSIFYVYFKNNNTSAAVIEFILISFFFLAH